MIVTGSPRDAGEGLLVDRLTSALASRQPFALSKVGFSEQALCVIPDRLASERDPARRRALEAALIAHGHRQGGLFPARAKEILTFSAVMRDSLARHDGLAIAPGRWAADTLRSIPARVAVAPLDSLDVRGVAAGDPLQVLLDGLAGADVLLVTTPAKLLHARANIHTFEAVWQRLGRRWFDPRSMAYLALPNGYDRRACDSWQDSVALLDWAVRQIEGRAFDVALIGAGLYGAPLAAKIKAGGRIGVSLGSQLQLLFGVQGRRWLGWEDFQRDIVNDHWICLPHSTLPSPPDMLPDGGAYWS
jgi:hypothetical protein